MKKFILSISFLTIVVAFSIPAKATIHTVLVGNYYFNPSSISNVQSGDTIRWVWVAGSHTTTSSSIPTGAASWDEPITSSSTTYEYVANVAGFYQYVCTPHAGMGQVGNFTVTAPPPPPLSVTATADDNALCMGQSTWLHAAPSGGTGGYSYSWTSVPPGFTSNQQNVQITPGITRTYQVTVTSGSQSANSSVAVSVTNPPSVLAGSDTTYCATVSQITVSGNATGYTSIMWTTTGDGTFTDPENLTSVYVPGVTDKTSPSIDLILTATAIAPCISSVSDSIHIILDPCLGLNDGNSLSSMMIYPNPSTGSFTLSGNVNGSSVIRISDMRGRIISEERIESPGDFTRSFNLAGAQGVYEVVIVSGKKISREKVILTGR